MNQISLPFRIYFLKIKASRQIPSRGGSKSDINSESDKISEFKKPEKHKTGQFVVFVEKAEILKRQTDLFNCILPLMLTPYFAANSKSESRFLLKYISLSTETYS